MGMGSQMKEHRQIKPSEMRIDAINVEDLKAYARDTRIVESLWD